MLPDREAPWALWGSDLSPFALKVEALCRAAGLPIRWLPREGGFLEGLRHERRFRDVRDGRRPLTYPEMGELDEFPLTPFLFGPSGENLYDSSAIAAWLDRERGGHAIPADPALEFAVRLVDEALDEIGIYLVHHNRWVVAARDNRAHERLARDYRPVLGPAAPAMGRWFARRQVRRLPYLFSVAPAGVAFDDLPKALRPPQRAGFPPTHALLDTTYTELLAALEPVFSTRPFLFGARFTLADASVYGQLGMNLSDASANARIARDAPATHAWLLRLSQGDFGGHRDDAAPALHADLPPLFGWICRIFVPLMQQNLDAWQQHRSAGETRFNEAAFDAGRALYDGNLRGVPFRHVAKTFQVRVWLELRRLWKDLDEAARAPVAGLLPDDADLDRDSMETRRCPRS